jgi:hypothetical protein
MAPMTSKAAATAIKGMIIDAIDAISITVEATIRKAPVKPKAATTFLELLGIGLYFL